MDKMNEQLAAFYAKWARLIEVIKDDTLGLAIRADAARWIDHQTGGPENHEYTPEEMDQLVEALNR